MNKKNSIFTDFVFASAGLLWRIACVLTSSPVIYGNGYGFGSICILGLVLVLAIRFELVLLCIDMLFRSWQDFLRQNNTGKLLWQVFGVHSASLCIFGIAEDEEIMWDEFKRAGV